MKTLNRICQVLCIVFGVGALVLFFMDFATIVNGAKSETVTGTVLAFGDKIGKDLIGKDKIDMAVSSKILFCLILNVLAVAMSAFSFKKKGLRYAVPFVALVDAVFMLVIRLSSPGNFIDCSALLYPADNKVYMTSAPKYTSNVTLLVIALFAFAVFAAAYLLIDDYIEVLASKGKKTIFQRIGLFFRDYKSEVKKIVWPTLREVVKNTVIVLIMCLIVGALIWLLDWGLGESIKAILSIKK